MSIEFRLRRASLDCQRQLLFGFRFSVFGATVRSFHSLVLHSEVSMKAIVFERHGGPEVLRYTEVAEPKVGHGEVLVRVRACALNHLDLWVRKGLPGVQIPMPHIPGSDIAGEIAKVGEGVTHT